MTDPIDVYINQFSDDKLQKALSYGDLIRYGFVAKPNCKKCYGRGYIGRDTTKMKMVYKYAKSNEPLNPETFNQLLKGVYVKCDCVREIVMENVDVSVPKVQEASENGVGGQNEGEGSLGPQETPDDIPKEKEESHFGETLWGNDPFHTPEILDKKADDEHQGTSGTPVEEVVDENADKEIVVEKVCKCGGVLEPLGGEYWQCKDCGMMFKGDEEQVTFGGIF